MQVISSGVEAVAAGYDHSMVLKQDGSVWTTGSNHFGQLGDAPETFSSEFVQVIAGGVQAVAAGNWHSMVVKSDGSLWAMGANRYGQLGDGSTRSKRKFVKVDIARNGMCCALPQNCMICS